MLALLFLALIGALLYIWCTYAPRLSSRTLGLLVLAIFAATSTYQYTELRFRSFWPEAGDVSESLRTATGDGCRSLRTSTGHSFRSLWTSTGERFRSLWTESEDEWWTEDCSLDLFPINPTIPPKVLQETADTLATGLIAAGKEAQPGDEYDAIMSWWFTASRRAYLESASDAKSHGANSSKVQDIVYAGDLPHDLDQVLNALEFNTVVMREQRQSLGTFWAIHSGEDGNPISFEAVVGYFQLLNQSLEIASQKTDQFERRVNWTLADLELFRQETMYDALLSRRKVARTDFLAALMVSAHLEGLVAFFRCEYDWTRRALDILEGTKASEDEQRREGTLHISSKEVQLAGLRPILAALNGNADCMTKYGRGVRHYLDDAFAASDEVGHKNEMVRRCIKSKCRAWSAWYWTPYRGEKWWPVLKSIKS